MWRSRSIHSLTRSLGGEGDYAKDRVSSETRRDFMTTTSMLIIYTKREEESTHWRTYSQSARHLRARLATRDRRRLPPQLATLTTRKQLGHRPCLIPQVIPRGITVHSHVRPFLCGRWLAMWPSPCASRHSPFPMHPPSLPVLTERTPAQPFVNVARSSLPGSRAFEEKMTGSWQGGGMPRTRCRKMDVVS